MKTSCDVFVETLRTQSSSPNNTHVTDRTICFLWPNSVSGKGEKKTPNGSVVDFHFRRVHGETHAEDFYNSYLIVAGPFVKELFGGKQWEIYNELSRPNNGPWSPLKRVEEN